MSKTTCDVKNTNPSRPALKKNLGKVIFDKSLRRLVMTPDRSQALDRVTVGNN